MDQQRFEQLLVQHRHSDGSWSRLTEQRAPHDAAEIDVERAWANRRLFTCTTCDEMVTIASEADAGPESR